jgi:hypothetical protein
MIRARIQAAADRPDDRFCERCGNPAGPRTTLTRAGLTTCQACGIHACERCWARSAGWCPACGVSIVAAPLQRTLPSEKWRAGGVGAATPRMSGAAAATAGRRSSRGRLPAVAAAGAALVVTATAFAVMFGVPLGPNGGVAGVTGTPGVSGLDGGGIATPVASQDGIVSDPSATERPRTGSGTTGAGAEPPLPGGGTQPPRPTPAPRVTPRPTTKPKPTPGPTTPPGCVATAPKLVGQHRSDARRLWLKAGFSGGVTALDGQGNYVISSQNRTPGAKYPCDTAVTIRP